LRNDPKAIERREGASPIVHRATPRRHLCAQVMAQYAGRGINRGKVRIYNKTQEGRRREVIGSLIRAIVLIIAAFIVSLIVGTYVFYFVGMSISLAAGAILGVEGVIIAQIFAWLGVVVTVILFGKAINSISMITVSEEESEYLERLLNDIKEKE